MSEGGKILGSKKFRRIYIFNTVPPGGEEGGGSGAPVTTTAMTLAPTSLCLQTAPVSLSLLCRELHTPGVWLRRRCTRMYHASSLAMVFWGYGLARRRSSLQYFDTCYLKGETTWLS